MPPGMPQEAVPSAPPRVLVVEDDARVRARVRVALDGVARVLEASGGTEALDVLGRRAGRAVDLALVNQETPRGSGLELLRLTKQAWPWVPVVIVTGRGSEDLAVQALRAGASDYLRKPVDAAELRRVVLTHARGHPAPTEPGARPTGTGGPGREPPPIRHLAVSRALLFVRDHFTDAITLSQVAREARLSKFHFCRLFRRHVGVSFRRYVLGLRIDRAKALLADRRLTVTEVAYAIGFNDLSHFDKVFNRTVGVSPTGYRRAVPTAWATADKVIATKPKLPPVSPS